MAIVPFGNYLFWLLALWGYIRYTKLLKSHKVLQLYIEAISTRIRKLWKKKILHLSYNWVSKILSWTQNWVFYPIHASDVFLNTIRTSYNMYIILYETWWYSTYITQCSVSPWKKVSSVWRNPFHIIKSHHDKFEEEGQTRFHITYSKHA